ncbi:MAG TPA: hypothetical protein VF103_17855, partial [Polyangiaceae bacterium]
VTYDFGEAFVAQNLVLEPVFDDLVTLELGRFAERNGDPLLGKLLFSLGEDSAWHREFAAALVRFAIEHRPHNRRLVEGWIERWRGRVGDAVRALAPLFDREEHEFSAELEARRARLWESVGIDGSALP